jgi:spore maturation protein CgeB
VDDTILEYRVAELSNLKATFFWDVDSPATIVRIRTNPTDPFRTVIPLYDAVLSYGGGPASRDGYLSFGAQAYYNIYNGLDPDTHYTTSSDPSFACDAVFLGNRLPDREIRVAELFFRAAELAPEMSFLLGGEGWGDYPIPSNVRWIGHVSSKDHNRINCSAGMVMNINRCSMASFGYSPPTRVFEAAGAGACILCDDWPGINECFEPDREILLVRCAEDVVDALRRYSEADRKRIGLAAHTRALQEHTYAQRAAQVEAAFIECKERRNQIQKVKCA